MGSLPHQELKNASEMAEYFAGGAVRVEFRLGVAAERIEGGVNQRASNGHAETVTEPCSAHNKESYMSLSCSVRS